MWAAQTSILPYESPFCEEIPFCSPTKQRGQRMAAPLLLSKFLASQACPRWPFPCLETLEKVSSTLFWHFNLIVEASKYFSFLGSWVFLRWKETDFASQNLLAYNRAVSFHCPLKNVFWTPMFLYKKTLCFYIRTKPGLLQSRGIRFTLPSVFHHGKQTHNQSGAVTSLLLSFP